MTGPHSISIARGNSFSQTFARVHAPLSPEASPEIPSESVTQLPSLTPLQFLVLDFLSGSNTAVSAHQLMQGLRELSASYAGPKFYQLMGRMVRDGLVIAESRTIPTPAGQIERTFYVPTEAGRRSLSLTRTFYETRHRLKATLG